MKIFYYLYKYSPYIATFLLSIVGAWGLIMPTTFKKILSSWWRYLLLAILIFFGVMGLISAIDQQNKLEKQISALISSFQVKPTTDEIKELNQLIRKEFAELRAIITKEPIKSIYQPEVQPPVVEHMQIAQRKVPSNNPEFPYGLQVIIQFDISIQPIALAIECTGEINDVQFFVAGQGVYFNIVKGISKEKNNMAIIKFTYPPVTPESPLVVTLLSKEDIKVKKVIKLAQ